MVEENYMEMKILLPFWLFLVRLHCCLVDAAERTTENNELWLAENEVWIRMRIGTTSNIKITRDEAISAHELNEICAFLLLTTFKVLSFSQPKYQQRLQQKTCQFLPSSAMRASANPNELKCRLSYIRKLYRQCNIYYWNYYNTKCHGIT